MGKPLRSCAAPLFFVILVSIPQPAQAQDGWIGDMIERVVEVFKPTGTASERMMISTSPPGAAIMRGARKLGETTAGAASVRLNPRALGDVLVRFASGRPMRVSDCEPRPERDGHHYMHCVQPR